MIARFDNIDIERFNFNGIPYYKTFVARRIGTYVIEVVGIYDSKLVLLPPTPISQVKVNNIIYDSTEACINALMPVLFDYPNITATMQAEIDAIRANVENTTATMQTEIDAIRADGENTTATMQTEIDNIRADGEIFKKDIVVNGDANKYYQVIISGGNQYKVRNLTIYRAFNEQAPSTWYTETHKGGLILDIRTNFGSWGGSSYDWKILDFRESYATMFAMAGHTNHHISFYAMLRGGGAIYHLESDQTLSDVQVVYSSSEITFDHEDSSYRIYGRDPLDTPNTSSINAHTYAVGV